MGKLKPGISIEEDIWKQFKEKFKNNASKKVEELMKQALKLDVPHSLNALEINSVTIPNPQNWSVNFNDGSMNLTHSVSCSSSNIESTSYTCDMKDIIIE